MCERLRLLEHLAEFGEERLDLSEYHHVLARRVVEHFRVDSSVVNKGRRHVPVGRNHTKISAHLRVHHRRHVILSTGRVKGKEPIPGLSHGGFAPQVIQFENKIS